MIQQWILIINLEVFSEEDDPTDARVKIKSNVQQNTDEEKTCTEASCSNGELSFEIAEELGVEGGEGFDKLPSIW